MTTCGVRTGTAWCRDGAVRAHPRRPGRLRRVGVRAVLVDPVDDFESDVPSIGAGNWAATWHLIELGHRRIGVVTGSMRYLCSQRGWRLLRGARSRRDHLRRRVRRAWQLPPCIRAGRGCATARDTGAADGDRRRQRRAGGQVSIPRPRGPHGLSVVGFEDGSMRCRRAGSSCPPHSSCGAAPRRHLPGNVKVGSSDYARIEISLRTLRWLWSVRTRGSYRGGRDARYRSPACRTQCGPCGHRERNGERRA